MVQIIPRTPSVGETLSQTLGALSGMTLGQQLGNYYQQQQTQQKQQLLQNQYQQESTLLQNALKDLGEDFTPQQFANKVLTLPINPESKKNIIGSYVSAQPKGPTKEEFKKEEEAKKTQHYSETLDTLEEMLPYTGSPLIPGKSFLGESPRFLGMDVVLNPEAVEKRNQFDAMAIELEGVLRDKATKGTLPQKTFQELLKRLPSSKHSEAENRGRIKAFRKILGASEKKELKNQKVKFDINNPEHKKRRDLILKGAQGNREKAEEALKKEFQ